MVERQVINKVFKSTIAGRKRGSMTKFKASKPGDDAPVISVSSCQVKAEKEVQI